VGAELAVNLELYVKTRQVAARATNMKKL